MVFLERDGALWVDDANTGYTLVFEEYNPATDLMGTVYHRPPDFFRAAVFQKTNDPQWSLPWWTERRPDAIFADQSEAIAHVVRLIAEA